MIQSRLILVDGIPGCGKSTMAQWLNDRLRQNALDSQWIFELDHGYPIRSRNKVKHLGHAPMLAAGIEDWQRLVCRARQENSINILDAAYFQKTILTFFDHQIKKDEIFLYLDKVNKTIDMLNPVIIYLYPSDIATHVTENYNLRGEAFSTAIENYITNTSFFKSNELSGMTGQIYFWTEYEKLCTELVSQSGLPNIKVDVSAHNWHEYQQRICEYLKIHAHNNSGEYMWKPESITGIYKGANSTLQCDIGHEAGNLWISNLMKPLEQKSALLSKGGNLFTVRGADVDLNFESSTLKPPGYFGVRSTWRQIDGIKLTRANEIH